jgi:hypothetical protein
MVATFLRDESEPECFGPFDSAPCTTESHAAATLDPAIWSAMPHRYVWHLFAGEPGLEARDCHCGSTLHRSLHGPLTLDAVKAREA